jgi:hypothetical protein
MLAVCTPVAPDPSSARAPVLLASLDAGRPTAAPRTVARALRRLAHPAARAEPAAPAALVTAARRSVRAWARRRAAADTVGVIPPAAFDTRGATPPHTVRAALARTDAALRSAPPHARGIRAAAVAQLRAALAHPLRGDAERALAAVSQLTDDDAWLADAHAAVAGAGPAGGGSAAPSPLAFRLTALVLLLP